MLYLIWLSWSQLHFRGKAKNLSDGRLLDEFGSHTDFLDNFGEWFIAQLNRP